MAFSTGQEFVIEKKNRIAKGAEFPHDCERERHRP